MRTASFFFVREKSKLVSLSCVSCKCLSLSDLNFERDLVRFQRGGKEGRGEKRGDRAKRHDEIIHGRGGSVFDENRSRGRGSEAGGREIQERWSSRGDLRSTETVVPFHL